MPCETEVSISRHLKYASSGFLAAALMASPLIAVADSHGIDSRDSDYEVDASVCNVMETNRRPDARVESGTDWCSDVQATGLNRIDAIIMGLLMISVLASFADCVLIATHSDVTARHRR